MRTFVHKKHYLLATMIVAAQVIWGQQVIISYNNSGTSSATIPSCATNVTGHVWGGGGGGGSGYSSVIGINIGGGGGGGAYNTTGFTTVNQPFSITVGAGGTGGVTGNPGNNGASGSISSIASPDYTLNANGGSGGGRTSGGTNPGSGGAGGSGGTYTGADGANGDVSAWVWSTITAGNGGGGAGSGGNASGQSGGQANGSLPSGGSGGGAVTGNSNGNPGIAPGGGGSGGRATGAGNHDGGNGGNGRAIIRFDISRPVISGTDNYCEGETLTLNVNNACTSANYIWKRDGNIEGYGATLTLNNLTPGKSGSYTVEYSFSYLNGTVSVTGAGLSSVDSTFTFTSVELDVTVKPRTQTPLLRRSYEGVCPIDEGEAEGYYSAADSLNIATPSNPGGVYFANHIVWDSLIVSSGNTDIPLNQIKWYYTETGNDLLKENGALTPLGITLQSQGLFNDFWQNAPHTQEIYWASILPPGSCESDRIKVEVHIYDKPVLNVPDLIGYAQPSGTLDLFDFLSGHIGPDVIQAIEWYGTEANAIAGNNEIVGGPAPLDLTQPVNTTYWLVIEGDHGCRSLPALFRVQLFPMPTINISPDTLVCPGKPVYVRVDINGASPYDFTITNSNSASIITKTDYHSDTYTLPIPIEPLSSVSYFISQFSDSITPLVTHPPLGLFVSSSGYFDKADIEVVVTEIISVTPSSGPTEGGTYTSNPSMPVDPAGRVTIVGSGFNPFGSLTPSVTVSFDGIPSTSVTVVSDNTITCIPPPRALSGYVTVSVTVACAYVTLTNGYHYEAMNITDVTPDYAPVTGGTQVTIQGTGLLASGYTVSDVWIEFCGVRAQEILSASNNEIVCITGQSGFSKLGGIKIFNGVESREFVDRFTYYPVSFVKNGSWSEPYNWETQTDDRILPYPGAIIHIKANCLQDINLDGSAFPYNGKMDSITVYPNKAYTINSGTTLNTNVFTLKDNASFLNFGVISAIQQNVEHTLAMGRNWYVSSPLQMTTIAALDSGALGNDLKTYGNVDLSSATVPSDWRVEKYIEQNHEWRRLPLGSNIVQGEGYTVYSKNEDIAVKFSGKYNNGDIPSPGLTRQNDAHVKRGFNLVGNPFPSYWRWTETAASNANVYSTIWYRTVIADHYEFWSYNAAGDVAVAPGWNDGTPTGAYSLAYIPPMQAFWVRLRDGESTGTINFANNNRSHADHASNMLRSMEIADKGKRCMLRIALSGSKNTDEILIYTDSRAQHGFDKYDSDKMFTDVGAELFTIKGAQNRELVINSLPEFTDGMELPLGIQTDEGGNFTLHAKEMLNMEPFDVYLRDSWRKTEYKLSDENPYHFTSGSGNNKDRFSIVFRSSGATNNVIINNDNDILRAYSDKEGRIIVLYNGTNNCNVIVYDILGNRITVQNIASKTPTALKYKLAKGIYVLRAGKYATKVAVQR